MKVRVKVKSKNKSKVKIQKKGSSKKLNYPQLVQRLKKAKLLLLDIDGVLTDGSLFFVPGNGWTRTFSVKDGYGMRMLIKKGFQVGVISGGMSADVQERMKFLGVHHAYFGNEDKIVAYDRILKETGFKDEEVIYVGDELFDLPVLRRVGVSATVQNAAKQVLKEVDYIIQTPGGHGAAREIIDALFEAQPGLVPQY